MERSCTPPKLHLVSHVHWDPMWYLSFEQYRMRLIRFMSRLFDVLDAEPGYRFMFDGQISALDDYLEIVPEDEPRIRGFVEAGRLLIGPWYIQPEEFMISGESHIRNLALGQARGRELGGTMPVSYLCDMVGHISQMPQLCRGFGLNSLVASRGVSGPGLQTSEFVWEGPDGSQVLFKLMPYGYSNMTPRDGEGFRVFIEKHAKGLAPWASTDAVLIMQGGDHLEPVPGLKALVDGYNNAVGREQLTSVTLPEHLDHILNSGVDLPIHKGEFRSTHGTFILTGILSTRMRVKLLSEGISRDLERWAEPFAAIASLAGVAAYPQGSIDHVWRKQLKNAFHDCIYGAHADSVTPDILNDYKRAGEVIDWVVNESLHALAKAPNSPCSEAYFQELPGIAVFNACPWDRRDVVVEASLFVEDATPKREFMAYGPGGDSIPVQVLSARKATRYTDLNGNWWGRDFGKTGHEYTLGLRIPEIPAMGYALIRPYRPDFTTPQGRLEFRLDAKSHAGKSDLRAIPGGCENAHLILKVHADATIDVYDKEMQRWYRGLHAFEDHGDAGDQYNYSPPISDRVYGSSGASGQVSLTEQGPARFTYRVDVDMRLPEQGLGPEGRSERLMSNPVTSFISLSGGSKTIEFRTVIENRSKDHRIRLLFPTGFKIGHTTAGSQFDVVERPMEPTNFNEQGEAQEKAWGNHPHRQFVDISDGTSGLAFLDRGIPEYEADAQGNLRITLLRCIGILSRFDLPERAYQAAGPDMDTPMAQEAGTHDYSYAINFHRGNWVDGRVAETADEFYAGIKSTLVRGTDMARIGQSMSFLGVDGEGILLSAVKPGKSPGELVIRVYNARPEKSQCAIRTWLKPIRACKSDLAENPVEDLEIGTDVSLAVGGHEIATVCLFFNDNPAKGVEPNEKPM